LHPSSKNKSDFARFTFFNNDSGVTRVQNDNDAAWCRYRKLRGMSGKMKVWELFVGKPNVIRPNEEIQTSLRAPAPSQSGDKGSCDFLPPIPVTPASFCIRLFFSPPVRDTKRKPRKNR